MTLKDQIGIHYEIIGEDGGHVGTVDRVEGDRIKLTKTDNGQVKGEHRYLPIDLVAKVEGEKVRLKVTNDVAISLEQSQ